MVKVKFYGTLLVSAGEKEYQSGARTVAELLREAEQRYGEGLGAHLRHCAVVVNGRSMEGLKGVKTKLRNGDEVALLPRIAGG